MPVSISIKDVPRLVAKEDTTVAGAFVKSKSSPKNTEIWRLTHDINIIANDPDAIFADGVEEAVALIRAGLGECYDDPMTRVEVKRYDNSITVNSTESFNEDFSVEKLKQYLIDNGPTRINGIHKHVGAGWPSSGDIERRTKLWDAGIYINLESSHGYKTNERAEVTEYNPKKARQQAYRCQNRGGNTNKTKPIQQRRHVIKDDLEDVYYSVLNEVREKTASSSIGMNYEHHYRSMGRYDCGVRVMYAVSWFNSVFGKNMHRRIKAFHKMCGLWRKTKDNARDKYPECFVVWMDNECMIKLPKIKEDFKIHKSSIWYNVKEAKNENN